MSDVDVSLHSTKRKWCHIDRLYHILNLSMAGAAATDTAMNLENQLAAVCAIFEEIYRHAHLGVEYAELREYEIKDALDAAAKGI